MKKLLGIIVLGLLLSGNAYADYGTKYGTKLSETAEFINCDLDKVKNPNIKRLFKYIGYDSDKFYLYYESRMAKKWFVLEIFIDKDFSDNKKLESNHFTTKNIYTDSESTKKIRYITLDKNEKSLTVYDQFNKIQFEFDCKVSSKKELKKYKEN